MGPGGAGKDTLLDKLRQYRRVEPAVVIAHRYITREVQPGGENHIPLATEAFRERERLGCFALSWSRDGIHYGIGREIDVWLAEGIHVVVNGSRAALSQAVTRYGEQLRPVLLHLPAATQRSRLLARGREDAEAVSDRVARDQALRAPSHARLTRLDATAPPGDMAAALLAELVNKDMACE
jgi:ribose 1,5-bisphosphokinase